MKIIFLIAGAIGIIDAMFRFKVMETNNFIALCTCTILCFLIYVHDSLEEKINNNNYGKSKKNNTDNGK